MASRSVFAVLLVLLQVAMGCTEREAAWRGT